MPKSALQKIDEKFKPEIARRASIAYGNEFIIDTLPRTAVFSGSTNKEVILQAQNIMRSALPVVIIDQGQGIFRSWSKYVSIDEPVTQTDLLENEDAEVQKLIYQVKTSSIQYREKLANRLLSLLKDSKEENLYSTSIKADSLRNFIKFLQTNTNLKYPSISLTPEFNIYASWRDEKNRILSVHFLSKGDARFIIFKPNYRHPERKIRISGITTTDILMEIVSFYNVSEWISE